MRIKVNKVLLAMAALVLGLLFYCPKSYACYGEFEAIDDWAPDAGFYEFLDEIEPGEYVEPEEPPLEKNLPHYILTDEDAELLLKIGVLEGGCDGVDGIGNVMQVVLNRFESDEFPHTIAGVIFQDGQFTTAKKLANASITPEQYTDAYAALDCVIFGDYLSNECYYFESMDGLAFASWADYSFSYGGHDFYM